MFTLRNMLPETFLYNPEVFAPLPRSWMQLPEDTGLAEIVDTFPEGVAASDIAELLEHPALPEVTLRFSESVGACQIVSADYLKKCATPHVAEGASRGLEIRFFAVKGRFLEYIGCHYCSLSGGMIRRCTGVPQDSPINGEGMERLRSAGDLWSHVFFALQFLLLRGGITPQRYRQRGHISGIRNGSSMTKLPGKVEIISLRGIDLRAAGERARKTLAPAAERERHCPVWPVRGHYRHYRSGKTVYIAPHVRGPERDTRPCPGREYAIGGPQS